MASSRSSSRSLSMDYLGKNDDLDSRKEERLPLTQPTPKSSKFLFGINFILFVLVVGLAIGVLIVGDIGRIFKDKQTAFNEVIQNHLNLRPTYLMKSSDSFSGYEPFGQPIALDQWVRKADMPSSRSDHEVVAIGSRIYVLGGSNNNGVTTLGNVEIYDVSANTWLPSGASMTQSRYRFAAAKYQDSIFVFGGRAVNDTALDSIEMYNTTTNTWTQVPVSMPSPRSDMTAVTIDSTIYVIGGYPADYSGPLDTVEAFDIVNQSWTTVSHMNKPRGDIHAVEIGGSILVTAGYSTNFSLDGTLEQYFPNRNLWIIRENIPVPRGDKGVSVLNGEYFTIGGEVSFNDVSGPISKGIRQTESYNPVTGIWTPRATFPIAAFRFGCAVVNNKIYCIGGHACDSDSQAGCISIGNQDEVHELNSNYEYSLDFVQPFRPVA